MFTKLEIDESSLDKGFTLKYTGRKINPDFGKSDEGIKMEAPKGMEALRRNFSEVGALAIRFQLILAQFAALIQPVCEEKYEENSIEQTANGDNQLNLFATQDIESEVVRDTRLLEQYSHYIIGKGKILNERSQPLRKPNTHDLHGGEAIWDTIHFAVWQTGISLSSHLSKQGFLYICHPLDMLPEEYKIITQELDRGEFEIAIENEEKIIKTKSGLILKTSPVPSNSKIDLDPEHSKTYQDNGFVITVNNEEAPVGWIIQEENKKLIRIVSEITSYSCVIINHLDIGIAL